MGSFSLVDKIQIQFIEIFINYLTRLFGLYIKKRFNCALIKSFFVPAIGLVHDLQESSLKRHHQLSIGMYGCVLMQHWFQFN